MAKGTLEVLLVSAKGLDDSDFLSGSDPYAILTYRTQEKTSGMGTVDGSCSEWNESFLFSISSDVPELKIKLMDKDTFTADDFIGEAIIPLQPLFVEDSLPPMAYHVVKDEEYRGEVRVALTFTPQRSRGDEVEEESLGGWKQSCVE
ncbi:16 kDa phloem protein 2-like [Salvia splendens]|uniref:16 kDa phloem protein 2-like n=1 Tax=Salvia splendens TaxID=180675 RepID=UPI001C27B538|nr:16 kDa phloem protein 2-like [Salvia splendens]